MAVAPPSQVSPIIKLPLLPGGSEFEDRKSTRLNSSHMSTSYAVFFLKKKMDVPSRHDGATFQHEVIAPVLKIQSYRDGAAAIAPANSTEYGLPAIDCTPLKGRAD